MQGQNIKELKTQLRELLEREALKRGKFILSSGKESNFYLDGRIITMTPQGAFLVGSILIEMLRNEPVNALGGPTLGADPIVGAVAALSHMQNFPLKTFIVRKAAKEHGTKRQVEGPALKKGDEVVIVDDVATTGKSLVEAKQILDEMDVVVKKAIVIVDRNEGAKENLAKVGCKLESIFSLSDLGL